MSDDMTAAVTAAYTALGPRWDTSGADWNRPVGAGLVARAGLAPGMRVLDLGCGAGAATIPAAAAVGPHGQVTGIDVADTMLDRARAAATAEGLANITLLRGDAAAPPFPPRSFDVILASLVVYLLADPAAAAARWRPLLAGGGVVAFSWVLAEDPVFAAAADDVDEFVAAGRRTWAQTWQRWKTPAGAEAILGTGYSAITTVTEPVTTRFDSPGHWWDSSLTQGPAVAWRHIPPGRRDEARAAAEMVLAPARASDGSLARVRTVAYTTACAARLLGEAP